MDNFLDTVIQTFNQKVESGQVQKIIDEKVDSFIKESVINVLCSYGDFSKSLKEKMSKELVSNLDRFSLAEYNSLILGMIRKKLDENYVGIAKSEMDKSLGLLFQKPEFKKFTDIIELMKKEFQEYAREEEVESATLTVEDKSHIVFVYYDDKLDVRDYNCAHRWTFHKEKDSNMGVLVSARHYDSESKKIRNVDASLSRMSRLDSILFHMIAYGTPIELDFAKAKYSLEYNWYDR